MLTQLQMEAIQEALINRISNGEEEISNANPGETPTWTDYNMALAWINETIKRHVEINGSVRRPETAPWPSTDLLHENHELGKRVTVLEDALKLIAERRDGLEGIWRTAEQALAGK